MKTRGPPDSGYPTNNPRAAQPIHARERFFGSSLMPSFNWHERFDELSRVRQQGNGDHDAGKEGRIYAETANPPADCPCDCDNDSHDHGREKKLHAVILAGDSASCVGGNLSKNAAHNPLNGDNPTSTESGDKESI